MPLCSGAPTLALLRSLANQRRKPRQETAMDDRAKLVALQRHWDASEAGNFEAENEI